MSQQAEPILQVDSLVKHYGVRPNITKALRGISMTIFRGEFVGVMGSSGSGKTTLLNVVSTIDTPTSGRVVVGSRDLSGLKGRELARFRREHLGFIFQEFNLLDTLTLRENIGLALSIAGNQRDGDRHVLEVARRLGIEEVLDKFPYQVSGGQKQRAAAARAIINKPDLILADEPTGALDSRSAQMLLEAMDDLNRTMGATIMMVTHDPSAASYCQRILFIQDGQIRTELIKGKASRREFFDQIMGELSLLGGGSENVR